MKGEQYQATNLNAPRLQLMHMEREQDLPRLLKVDIGESIKSAIQNVSGRGSHQKKILIFFLVVSLVTNIQLYSSNLYYMNPVFECEGIEGKATEEEACEMLNFCRIIDEGTITAEMELYCDERKDSRTLIQTTVGFGNLVGLLLGGWFSDVKGRKLCFCFALLVLNLTWACQLVGVHLRSVSLLLLSEFVSGVSGKMAYLNFLLLLTRFLKKEGYEAGTLGWLIVGNGLSQIVIAGLNELFSSWRVVASTYVAGTVLCSFLALLLVREDPVFLFDSGRLKESKAVIEAVGEENGEEFRANQQNLKQLDYAFEVKMLQIERSPRGANIFTLREILRCDILEKILIIGLAGCLYNMAGKSIELSIQSMEFSYNFNLFIVGFSNICGFATAIYVIKVEPQRKRGLMLTSCLYGIVAMLFLFPFCTENGSVETAVVFCLRFLLCWSCNFYTRLKVDSFPEKYQMTIIAAIEIMVNVGTLISPSLVQLAVDHKLSPIVLVNVLRIVLGTLPVLLLNEERAVLHLDSPLPLREGEKAKEISA